MRPDRTGGDAAALLPAPPVRWLVAEAALMASPEVVGMEPRMRRQLQSKVFLWKCHRSGLQSQVCPSRRSSPVKDVAHS